MSQEAEETKTDANKSPDTTNGLAETPKSIITGDNCLNENTEKQPKSSKQKELCRKKSSTENEDSAWGPHMNKVPKSSHTQNSLK